MLIVLHGENQPALRQELLNLKSRYGSNLTWEKELSELESFLLAPTFSILAGQEELVVIENPSFGEAAKLFSRWGEATKSVVVTFSRSLKKSEIAKLGSAKVLFFREEVPNNAFAFLDAVAAKNRTKALAELKRLRGEGADADYLLKMLGWSLRNLSQVKGGEGSELNPYVFGNLKKVASRWESADLTAAYGELLAEDQRQKKGRKVPFDFLVDKLAK